MFYTNKSSTIAITVSALVLFCAGLLQASEPLNASLNDSMKNGESVKQTASLTIKVAGLKGEQKGKLLVFLFLGNEHWLDNEKAAHIQALNVTKSSEMEIIFNDLAVGGEYAVSVVHDENENGKMDFQIFPPRPKEGVGVSNNTFRMGPPDYKKAKFLLQEDTISEIQLRY